MNTDVLVIGLVVGCANYLFRYLPLRLAPARAQPGIKRGKAALLLDSIGIASICALLVVSSTPVVMREPDKLLPTLAGFAALALCFYRSKSIILSTLLGATAFGVTLKFLMFFGPG
ncbi:L-valine transporter subunit YgaH [Serratia marcescens]|uniref:L-valine transporter subunit YgaH n=1 Tax=Serratia TaxID=613 RepID=UPI00114EACD2|nr:MULTISPECIES: L-valine transporter subunit YgaH [Serratia]MBF4188332.1 L-valine transporter subunit YgaH [Serratia ureilytica]MBF8442694.1 L-valine transporter subunit YgaH [Serratia ureilytica]MBF8447485.1 L-valine transporter subunit YgaH [Serratia ureilytica]MBH3120585.1 L-valine transporter subunit YgaH [Serratia ureilytica]MBH3142367.1 L-valine transporter subunit YgaH [Serratia ureilytica]